jgi:hypothetical protein
MFHWQQLGSNSTSEWMRIARAVGQPATQPASQPFRYIQSPHVPLAATRQQLYLGVDVDRTVGQPATQPASHSDIFKVHMFHWQQLGSNSTSEWIARAVPHRPASQPASQPFRYIQSPHVPLAATWQQLHLGVDRTRGPPSPSQSTSHPAGDKVTAEKRQPASQPASEDMPV